MTEMKKSGSNTLKSAADKVYDALVGLDVSERVKVVKSVMALFDVNPAGFEADFKTANQGAKVTEKPKSLVELKKESNPRTNAQLFTVFAYYHELATGNQKFSPEDLKAYFALAREKHPGKNYNRDFGKAVSHGWIHPDGSNSYLTETGLAAIKNSFAADSESSAIRSVRSASKRRRS